MSEASADYTVASQCKRTTSTRTLASSESEPRAKRARQDVEPPDIFAGDFSEVQEDESLAEPLQVESLFAGSDDATCMLLTANEWKALSQEESSVLLRPGSTSEKDVLALVRGPEGHSAVGVLKLHGDLPLRLSSGSSPALFYVHTHIYTYIYI